MREATAARLYDPATKGNPMRLPRCALALLTLVVAVALPPAVKAQEPAPHPSGDYSTVAPHEGARVRHHRSTHHANHLALFLGNTRSGGQDGFTVGGDYEHRFIRWLGAGPQVDYARDLDALTVTGAAFFHPFGNLRLLAAPGIEHEFESEEEHVGGEEAGTLSTEAGESSRNKFVFRVGAFYDFFIGRFTITPTFELDVKSGKDVKVFGISLGYEF